MNKRSFYLKLIHSYRFRWLGISKLGTYLLKQHNKQNMAFTIDDAIHRKCSHIDLCPHCFSQADNITVCGQKAFGCRFCLSWGPWANRIAINLNKKEKHILISILGRRQ